jgi:hypothetical protein
LDKINIMKKSNRMYQKTPHTPCPLLIEGVQNPLPLYQEGVGGCVSKNEKIS